MAPEPLGPPRSGSAGVGGDRAPRPGRSGGPPGPHRLGPSPPLYPTGPRGSALPPEQVRAKPGGTQNGRAVPTRGEGGPGGAGPAGGSPVRADSAPALGGRAPGRRSPTRN
uniref:Uncharacterized protein n=1 Tax=Rangifer tarandus platyrhynchus TaxID=3082113 RepID=A0ACB0EZ61_RANTA|nr:unnamed protein product [Rangifer tarandus platyrhynchus]